jgi:glyoxylase-like metal-dependent hydrolase (beta-lactamase superfamily II)
MEPAQIQREVSDGEELPIAGGVRAIHVPGHCAGQIALLWPWQGGVLFAADAAGNTMGRLGWSLGYEDLEEGKRSLARLGGYSFEVACFGHGSDLKGGASDRFREKWGDASAERQRTAATRP